MPGTNFRLTIAEPTGPTWAGATPSERAAFYREYGRRAIAAHRDQTAKGLNRFGVRMRRRKRPRPDGATGPPLLPHLDASRTAKRLRFVLGKGFLTVYWSHGWGKILGYHGEGAVRGGPGPGDADIRDVRGLEPKREEKLHRGMADWWAKRHRGAKPSKPAPKPKAKPVVPVRPKPLVPARPKPVPTPVKPAPRPIPAVARPPGTDPTIPEYRTQHEYIATEQARALETMAAEVGLTPAAYRERIGAAVKGAVSHGEFYIRADSGTLPAILDSGRFKTQFETGTSGGSLDPSGRRTVEAHSLGVPKGTPPAARPIYGYVSAPDFRAVNTRPELPVANYGDVVVRLKPALRERATITVGDSLVYNDRTQARPATAPDAATVPMNSVWTREVHRDLFAADHPPAKQLEGLSNTYGYVEAQYHGGVSVADIAEIALPREPDARLRARLSDLGIPYRVIRAEEN